HRREAAATAEWVAASKRVLLLGRLPRAVVDLVQDAGRVHGAGVLQLDDLEVAFTAALRQQPHEAGGRVHGFLVVAADEDPVAHHRDRHRCPLLGGGLPGRRLAAGGRGLWLGRRGWVLLWLLLWLVVAHLGAVAVAVTVAHRRAVAAGRRGGRG